MSLIVTLLIALTIASGVATLCLPISFLLWTLSQMSGEEMVALDGLTLVGAFGLGLFVVCVLGLIGILAHLGIDVPS